MSAPTTLSITVAIAPTDNVIKDNTDRAIVTGLTAIHIKDAAASLANPLIFVPIGII
jgi:hypothetical protein